LRANRITSRQEATIDTDTGALTLNTIILPVADAESLYRLKDWYMRLGLKHAPPDSPDESVWFEVGGGVTFGIHTSDAPAPTSISIYFNIADVDEAYARLAGHGFNFDAAPADKPWGGRVAYLKDPCGNSVGLVRRL
jgi:predicted enzyme related to lactoylglutathione lyase